MSIPIRYKFIIKIPWAQLKNCTPIWDVRLNGHVGMVHAENRRGYPLQYRRSTNEWYEYVIDAGLVGKGTVIATTCSNPFQNLRSPWWSAATGICQQAAERAEESRRPYWGLGFLGNGRVRPMKVDFREGVQGDVKTWLPGTPVLWDGRILGIEEMAPEVPDFGHLWQLQTSLKRGRKPEDVERFKALDRVFRNHLHSPAAEAGAAICEAARGLVRERNYLHHAIGVDESEGGGIIIILAHGSLEHIGELARRAGAVACVVTENGGSCRVSVKEGDGGLRPLAQSYYYRDRRLGMVFWEITEVPDGFVFEGTAGLGDARA